MGGIVREVGERTDDIDVSVWDKDANYEWKAEWMMLEDDTVSWG